MGSHRTGCAMCCLVTVLCTSLLVTICAAKTISKPSHKGTKHSDRVLYGEPVTILEEEFIELDKKGKKPIPSKEPFQLSQSPVQTCVAMTIPICRDLDLYPLSQYPNHLGHRSQEDAMDAMGPYLPLLKDSRCRNVLRKFLCLLYAPQCSGTDDPLPPCRGVCVAAWDACWRTAKDQGVPWPAQWKCDRYPKDGLCVEMFTRVTPVPQPKLHKKHPKSLPIKSSNSLPQSQTTINSKDVKLRNYNIRQLGQSEYFQGWADVQGQGAANDYCRVIGTNSHLWFLSCSLGGKTSVDHHYVSKRGFDVGHRHTWFMRDMDGDGKDDYCRCVGKGLKSYVSCMKAGQFGFVGSPQEPGNEYSFTIKTSGPCYQKEINPFIGI